MNPIVTVLIRTYNSKATIQRAVESVIDQTVDSEIVSIIIVDDGSTDDTLEIIRFYDRIEILETSHQGSLGALNFGLSKVTTPYVILLDSDDWFESDILEKMLTVVEEKPTIDFVYSDYYEIINDTKKIVSVKENILHTVAAGILFSMNILRENGFYDESLLFPEYDLLLKILPTAQREHVPYPLYNYFRRSDSLSSDKVLIEKGKRELRDKYGEYFSIRDY